MGTINVNGKTVNVPDGCTISVINGTVYVNGKAWEDQGEKLVGRVTLDITGTPLEIKVEHGDVNIAHSVGGNVDAGGSVTVGGMVGGSVDAGGSVTCGDVHGDVDAGGSVKCGKVSGDVDAGGSVRHG